MIFLALTLGATMWLVKQTESRRRRLAMCAVVILMALDVLSHTPRQNPTVPNRAYGPLRPDMTSVPQLGEARAMISPPMQRMLESAATADPFTLFTGYRRMLLSDCNLIDHVPKVNGFFSLYLREADEVKRRLYGSTNYNLPLIDFLGVSQISDAEQLFAWHTRNSSMPWVTAGQAPVFALERETFDAIFSPGFDPRRVAYLPAEMQSQVTGVQSNACRVTRFEVKREKVSAEIEATGTSLVLFAQAYYSPWKAFIDGKPAPLLKANYAYQAVAVPAGGHHVELRYQDRLFHAGGIISAATLLVCGAAAVFRRRERRAE